jgi:hypothetical protein
VRRCCASSGIRRTNWLVALRLSAALSCTVTVVARLHVDDATGDDIRLLLENCDRAIVRLTRRLRQRAA